MDVHRWAQAPMTVSVRAMRRAVSPVAGRVVGIYLVLAAANLGAWGWAAAVFHSHPVVLGTALLAYSLGLRHAVDADHIAAIDNVTRKLMQDGQRPVTVGFFFSLGHSTVVVLASIAIAATATALRTHVAAVQQVGGVIGTIVSAVFLFAIALLNLFVLASLYRTFRRVRSGGSCSDIDIDTVIAGGGLLARIFRPLFRLIDHSWYMYPLGFLFGLGFDTASEIGLLGISAAGASKGMSIWSILVFPALFAAGMSLIDTTDGILMLGAYGWAFVKPLRKLYYNLTITSVSVAVALVVGGVEALGLIGDKLQLGGPFWSAIGTLNHNFGTIGILIIGVFVGSWILSVILYQVLGLDRLDAPSTSPGGRDTGAHPTIALSMRVPVMGETIAPSGSSDRLGPSLERVTGNG
jgi:nickel/cobalt transporter (NiCoT) family protein